MRSHWEGESGKCNSQGISHLQWRRKQEEGTGRNLTFDRQMILLVVGRVDVLFIVYQMHFKDVFGSAYPI